jgi:hypothetical protein
MTTKISEFACEQGLVCRSGEDAEQRRRVRFGRRTRGFCQEAEPQRVVRGVACGQCTAPSKYNANGRDEINVESILKRDGQARGLGLGKRVKMTLCHTRGQKDDDDLAVEAR